MLAGWMQQNDFGCNDFLFVLFESHFGAIVIVIIYLYARVRALTAVAAVRRFLPSPLYAVVAAASLLNAVAAARLRTLSVVAAFVAAARGIAFLFVHVDTGTGIP